MGSLFLSHFSANFFRVDGGWQIHKIILVAPSASLDQFEAHLLGQAIPVVNVGAGIDSTNNGIGTDSEALDDVGAPHALLLLAKEPPPLQMLLDIDAEYGPQRPFDLVWNLERIAAGHRILLVHIRNGEPDWRLAILNPDVHVNDEELLRQDEQFEIELL